MYLIISTLPHFCSILPLIKYYRNYTLGYISIIIVSSTFSILYHLTKESNYLITYLDYLFAILWAIYDLYFGYTLRNNKTLYSIILGNSIVFIINMQIPYDQNYMLNHSIWHTINACKCFYISFAIGNTISKIDKL